MGCAVSNEVSHSSLAKTQRRALSGAGATAVKPAEKRGLARQSQAPHSLPVVENTTGLRSLTAGSAHSAARRSVVTPTEDWTPEVGHAVFLVPTADGRRSAVQSVDAPKWVTQEPREHEPLTWSNSCDRLGALLLREAGSASQTDRAVCRVEAREYYKTACGKRCEMSAKKLRDHVRAARAAEEAAAAAAAAAKLGVSKPSAGPSSYGSTRAPASWDTAAQAGQW